MHQLTEIAAQQEKIIANIGLVSIHYWKISQQRQKFLFYIFKQLLIFYFNSYAIIKIYTFLINFDGNIL